ATLRSRNALARGLFTLALAALCTVLFGVPASADGPTTPRAVPAARALPRTFGSYDDLIAYASSIAADQAALDQKQIDTRAQYDATVAELAAIVPEKDRGGALFDVDTVRQTRAVASTLSLQAATLSRTEQQLTT